MQNNYFAQVVFKTLQYFCNKALYFHIYGIFNAIFYSIDTSIGAKASTLRFVCRVDLIAGQTIY